MTAELRIREFIVPEALPPDTQRASLEELARAVIRQAEARPQEASFWQAISDIIAQQMAVIDGAPSAD
jgi:hypothetical protein